MNVVRCPKCGLLVDELNAAWKPAALPHTYTVIHVVPECGHSWTAHHREFHRPGEAPRRPPNPFDPVRLM